jgi:acetyl-CoA acetyltransferase
LTGEDLAHVAVATRKHAVNNPAAFFYGKELTIEEHQASRFIASRCACSIAARRATAGALA